MSREEAAATLDGLHALGALSELDLHFAAAMARLAGERDERVLLATALVSRNVQAGHVCLDLPRLCRDERMLETEEGPRAIAWPEVESWLAALRTSALNGDERAVTPLYLDREGRLYLRRYFEHERSLAAEIGKRVAGAGVEVDREVMEDGLERMFGDGDTDRPGTGAGTGSAGRNRRRGRGRGVASNQLDLFAEASETAAVAPDRQREAARCAVMRALCVISGGPGTGKTSTVAKILALLVEQAFARALGAPRVLLLAPTGKAAARLSEAMMRAKRGLRASPQVLAAISEHASTIHRALGAIGGHGQRFRHHREAPLAADVVVVDEASMVDLALMARLFEAVLPSARVILLGDKDQLASVEAGAVLGDICGAGRAGRPAEAPIAESIALLTRSYRYGPESGIGRLADAVNRAQSALALELLRDPALPDVSLVPVGRGAALPESLWSLATSGFAPLLGAQSAADKLRALDRFAILCAHRRGPFGQLAINARVETALREAGLLSSTAERYPGRPVIVTQNDHQARLFNGEVGVLLRDPDGSGRLLAYFPASDGGLRTVTGVRLPPHESAYALSVHKSQGSEFDEVAVVLPSDPSPVLSRELLYTALTRARHRVVVYASEEILDLAIRRSVHRSSGLRAALWGS